VEKFKKKTLKNVKKRVLNKNVKKRLFHLWFYRHTRAHVLCDVSFIYRYTV